MNHNVIIEIEALLIKAMASRQAEWPQNLRLPESLHIRAQFNPESPCKPTIRQLVAFL